ncbi:MAG: restriction endonuclease subunit S [Gilliamella sp.]|uniref:restriction endonuclease subunit S n=1 Tax=Gilliamella sp. TaxID=1891236 RepID=UPI0025FD85BF|nr:restriction endonuclease subunit S [Gilliamella sp.]MCO6549143.1 restriction endonuclease subunit S [Gilliamella sp.]
MSQSKKLIPKRRFKGFEKSKEFCQIEWQKLVERLTVMSSAHCLPRVEFEDIISGQGELNKDVFKKINDKRGIEFKKGDILFGKLRPYLKNWLYAGFDGIAVGDFWVFRPTFSNGGFIYALIQTNQYQKVANQSTGTKMPRSDWNIVSNTKFIVTTNKIEQTQIGEFFKKLDNLINTQQKKLEKAKTLKSAYLREMFPNEGELKPRLRFSGFRLAWEKYQLGEVAHYRRGAFPQPYGYEKWYNGNNSQPFVQVVDVTNQLKLAHKTKQRISKLAQPFSVFVPAGKIIVTLQGSIGRVAITQYDSYIDRTLLVFENFIKKIDLTFWAYTIQQLFEIEKKKAPGGTIKTITKEALSNFYITLPTEQEQTKIGNFFKLLDDKIALEQKKLDKLKNIKQAYLNEMFV